jgi:hypothetical protein
MADMGAMHDSCTQQTSSAESAIRRIAAQAQRHCL